MDEGAWITESKKTALFEGLIARYTKAKHCIVVNNGTIALTVAGAACGIKHGDEIIVPNYTMIATPNSFKLLGATPVFVDIEPDTLCLDIKDVKNKISPSTKAIVLVSANGRYPKAGIQSLVKLCKKNKIFLIEDAAQSLGSHYPDNSHIGTIGDLGTFSFSSPKVISTGQGGAIVTNNDDLALKIRRLKDFGRAKGGNDIHDTIGYNFKFTDLQACIGIEQMKKLPWRVERKKKIFKKYQKLLKTVPQIKFFNQDLKNTTPWFIDVLAENRNGLKTFLENNGIGTRTMYPPINKQQAYKTLHTYPVSELVGLNGLWLPSASQLTDEKIEYVCSKIREV